MIISGRHSTPLAMICQWALTPNCGFRVRLKGYQQKVFTRVKITNSLSNISCSMLEKKHVFL